MKRKLTAMLLALCLCASLALPAMASGYIASPESLTDDSTGYLLASAVNDSYDLSYTYDEAGRLTQVVNTKTSATAAYTETYSYDAQGRLSKVTRNSEAIDDPVMPIPASTTEWTYVYDTDGKLTKILFDGENEANVFTYDNQGRLIGELDDMGNPITYTYDANGRVASSNTDGFTLQYKYDNDGRLIERANAEEGYWERFTYDANGNHVKTETSDGEVTTFQYTAKPTSDPTAFTDVAADAYYYDAVVWAVEEGVTTGTTATTFSPDDTVTRAQAMTFLWRASGEPGPKSTESSFSDVSDPDAYYYKAVLWAVENGITNGISSDQFAPKGTLTYDQILAFMYRLFGSGTFGDDWSAEALNWAAENGLTNGLEFTAKEDCPRCDVVYCMWKMW